MKDEEISLKVDLPGQSDIFGVLSTINDVIECSTPAPQPEPSETFFTEDNAQLSFVDSDEWWKEHWVGMPEFIQNDLEPWKSIYVHFATREDMKAFASLVGQSMTSDTRSIWYPKAEIGRMSDKVFING